MIVFAHPRVQLVLRRLQRGKHSIGAKLHPQCPVKPLHLPRRRRRPRLGQQMLHRSRRSRSNNISTGGWLNPPVNTFPLSVRTCCGNPYLSIANNKPSPHCGHSLETSDTHSHRNGSDHQCQSVLWSADRPLTRTRPQHPSATDPSPPRAPTASTSDPAACGQQDRSTPAAATPDTPPTPTATARHPSDPTHRPDDEDPTTVEHASTALTPPRQTPASDAAPTPADATDPPTPPAHHPHNGATTHAPSCETPETRSDFRHRRPLSDDRQHSLIPLLSHRQLPHIGSVTHQPETVSPITRNTVTHQAKPKWNQSGEVIQHSGAACQNRTDDLLITSEMLYRLS